MLLVPPGSLGRVHILHHGFSCVTPAGPALIFIQENLSDCSYFKILPRNLAVEQIKRTTGTRSGATNCPTLAAMLGAVSAEKFKNLPVEASNILQLQPNHLMINPDHVFVMANGASTVAAKTLAFAVISWFRGDPKETKGTRKWNSQKPRSRKVRKTSDGNVVGQGKRGGHPGHT
jgi:hypothetical protein